MVDIQTKKLPVDSSNVHQIYLVNPESKFLLLACVGFCSFVIPSSFFFLLVSPFSFILWESEGPVQQTY